MRPVRPRITKTPPDGSRDRDLSQVIRARRRLGSLQRGGGRAWINGREVGGTDPRLSHLHRSYD